MSPSPSPRRRMIRFSTSRGSSSPRTSAAPASARVAQRLQRPPREQTAQRDQRDGHPHTDREEDRSFPPERGRIVPLPIVVLKPPDRVPLGQIGIERERASPVGHPHLD